MNKRIIVKCFSLVGNNGQPDQTNQPKIAEQWIRFAHQKRNIVTNKDDMQLCGAKISGVPQKLTIVSTVWRPHPPK